ncbi:MAG: HAD family hydrolase [Deltaproteobacteria bacterium]|nr:HAD family hydrolase [Deltaproteobacteria bacterium]MBW2595437.1 HAD family hydrolase [Deltaproteobacteria bacterium]MBW2650570.1 HAD family hydrolase [Deltaproteobacteria bacterium]
MSFDKLIKSYSRPVDTMPVSISRRGTLESAIKAILFDVYGTLFISEAGDISVAKEWSKRNITEIAGLLDRYCINISPHILLEEFFREIERGKERLVDQGINYPEIRIEEIWEKVLGIEDMDRIKGFAVEYELVVNPVYPMPHLEEMLNGCRKKNIPMGVISNAQFYTPCLFTSLLGNDLAGLGFVDDLVLFSYVLGYGKPSLDIFDKAAGRLEKMEIGRKDVLYVGNDMLKDILPAMTTGFQTALFAGDGRSLNLREDDRRCKGVSSDIIVTDLLQILEYI